MKYKILIYSILSVLLFSCNDKLDYNYPSFDWASYHDYKCIDVFPSLKFLFPYIKQCLDIVGDKDYNKYYFKSWVNIWPKGQQIIRHNHYGVWHGYLSLIHI